MKKPPRRAKLPATGDPFLDQPERIAEIAIEAFTRAKKAAIEENDRLGIPSYGSDETGRIVVRHPPKPAP